MTEPRAFTRMDFENMVCCNEGCRSTHQVVTLHAHCHHESEISVRYDKDRDPGVLQIICVECDSMVGRIRIAAEG